MSRKIPKSVKRRLKVAEAERTLLRNMVKAHEQWEKDREESFREIPSYNPVPDDQPCTDEDMGDYDVSDDKYACYARDAWTEFSEEARELLSGSSR